MKIYSWNVLNPNINISYKTWSKFNNKTLAKRIAQADFVRFSLFRKQAIINTLKHWLKTDKVIICLQEVNNELLTDIKNIKNVVVNNTTLLNDNCQTTIVKGYNVVASELILNINNKDKRVMKTTLNNNCEIYNVHLHWTWNSDDISIAGRIIEDSLKTQYFVVCGDMNKTYETIEPFMNEFDCLEMQKGLKGYTGINTETGNLDIIDHIFLSTSLDNHSDIKIISKVNNFHILYNFDKIFKLFKYKKYSVNEWIENRINKDISDHKPIMIKIRLI